MICEGIKVLTAKVAKIAKKSRTLLPEPQSGFKRPPPWIKIRCDEYGGIPKKS
jgi:hypothetical protein